MFDSYFNKDSRNIIFFQEESLILGEGRPENVGKIGNNRDIVIQIREGPISKGNVSLHPRYQNPCGASIFSHARPNFGDKNNSLYNLQMTKRLMLSTRNSYNFVEKSPSVLGLI